MIETLVRKMAVTSAEAIAQSFSCTSALQIYLGGLGVVTIFIGWRALRHRLEARMHSKKD